MRFPQGYKTISKIGEGAHGIVLKALSEKSGQIVALKKVPLRNLEKGIPNSIIREIKALEQLKHPHVVRLLEVFASGPGIVLVFEYMLSDLAQVLKTSSLSESQAKSYMLMMLKGVSFCHKNGVIHRDLKPANLLISHNRILKLADFGLARVLAKDNRPMSHQVATRWYRAPELLYGSRSYDAGVDLWAVGCIFAEMLTSHPIFPGQNDIDQLLCVVSVLGTPTWDGVQDLPDFNKITFPDSDPVPLESICPDCSPDAIRLLSKFLVYDPKDRISADAALKEQYFYDYPLPAHHLDLPFPVKIQKETFDTEPDLDLGLFSNPKLVDNL